MNNAVGIVVPAVIFILSYAVTYLLYRHFSKGPRE
jgi:cbb3-type cytochrome oxidase subunit 3